MQYVEICNYYILKYSLSTLSWLFRKYQLHMISEIYISVNFDIFERIVIITKLEKTLKNICTNGNISFSFKIKKNNLRN